MVYPALTYLEEVGYATVEAEGSKKLYRITDAGLARLNEDRALAEAVFFGRLIVWVLKQTNWCQG